MGQGVVDEDLADGTADREEEDVLCDGGVGADEGEGG